MTSATARANERWRGVTTRRGLTRTQLLGRMHDAFGQQKSCPPIGVVLRDGKGCKSKTAKRSRCRCARVLQARAALVRAGDRECEDLLMSFATFFRLSKADFAGVWLGGSPATACLLLMRGSEAEDSSFINDVWDALAHPRTATQLVAPDFEFRAGRKGTR